MSIELCTICLEPLLKNGDSNSNIYGNIDGNGKDDILIESKKHLVQIAPRIDLNPDKTAPTKEEMDEYIKSLMTIQINNLLEDLITPILQQRKKDYEDNFKYRIWHKREELRKKLQKKYKNREIILPF